MQHERKVSALRQRLQQRLSLLEVSRIKPFGEPAVDRCQEGMGFLAFALLLPEPSQAGGSTEFPGFGVLMAAISIALWKLSSASTASSEDSWSRRSPLKR